MRFVCDRCGKKYATAGDPAPGKVYKLKCKACGHLIVVKGQAGTMTGIPALTAAEVASATQMQEPAHTPVPTAPEAELHVEPEPLTTPVPTPEPGTYEAVPEQQPEQVSDDFIEPLPAGPAGEAAPLPLEVALAVDSAAGASGSEPLAPPTGSEELPEASPMLLDPALTPPPPEKDELADFAAAAAEVMAEPSPATSQAGDAGFVELFGNDAAGMPGSDRFAAAARASLPDTWAGATPGAAPPAPRPVPLAPSPAPAKARPQKSGLSGTPIAIIGVGMLALIGITAYALLGHAGSPAPAVASPGPAPTPAPPKPETPPPTPPALAPVAENPAKPVPEPRVAEKKPEPRLEPRARPPERKPEKKPEPKVAEKTPEPARPPPPPAPAPEPRTETRDVELPDAAAALTQDVVNRVVGANRKAFSTCISAASGSDVKLDGRRVALRITVNTNGTVTYPTLDDQSLNTTEMGQCLKSAARLMIFPKFKGDPFHYEVPLILSGN
jgi:DNA-directed RNA polymerase subunit RPC12/RpoP